MGNYLRDSMREFEANSGQNLYNKMVQRGSRRAGLTRERAYQAADDLLGADPAVLQPALLQINEQAGRDFQGVDENAGIVAADTARELAKFKYNVGLQEQARRDAERNRTEDLIGAGVGALIGTGGMLYGAKIGADALRDLRDLRASEPTSVEIPNFQMLPPLNRSLSDGGLPPFSTLLPGQASPTASYNMSLEDQLEGPEFDALKMRRLGMDLNSIPYFDRWGR